MFQRDKTNEDIMHYLLISSDPFLANVRDKKTKEMTKEAKKFLRF